jgi:SAM-dependent methyltransferase
MPERPTLNSPAATVRDHFNITAESPTALAKAYRKLLGHYYRLLLPENCSILELGCGSGELLALLPASKKVGLDIATRQIEYARDAHPSIEFIEGSVEALAIDQKFDVIIVSDTINYLADVQETLSQLQRHSRPDTRLLINAPNTLWRPFFGLANILQLRQSHPANSWLSGRDVRNLLELAHWDVIKSQPRALFPFAAGALERFINRTFAPFLPWFCMTEFFIARPSIALNSESTDSTHALPAAAQTSVSIVVPARNEAGNIESAITRTPKMGAWIEFIFVEGGSSDHTWAEIQRVKAAYPEVRIKSIQQTGKGKGNAVREGYALAEGDILMILDTDLTMPPEELPKYFDALTSGHCEFANGCRLVYPMEDHAMQFLNMLANKTFGILFSWLLGQQVKDTLCGTKVLRRTDYLKLAANRAYFGDFDPFGDFDLIFGADRMNLKIRDIPIRYRDRTYGSTNINRWSHGWLLLRMVLFAARKLKFV